MHSALWAKPLGQANNQSGRTVTCATVLFEILFTTASEAPTVAAQVHSYREKAYVSIR